MPTFSNQTNQESLKIFLNSKDANLNLGTSHFLFQLKDSIKTLHNHHIKLSLLSATIPTSFYQINSLNNLLNGSVNGSSFSFTIEPGNYSSKELATELNNKFTAASLSCVVSYSEIKNAFTLTATNISLLSSSTMLSLLGFSSSGITGSTNISSSISANIQPIRILYVKCLNLSVKNRKNSNTSNIIASIPIDVERNNFIFYKSHSNIATELYMEEVDLLDISITDENDNQIDFRGMDLILELGIVFDVIKPPPPEKPTIVKDLESLVELE